MTGSSDGVLLAGVEGMSMMDTPLVPCVAVDRVPVVVAICPVRTGCLVLAVRGNALGSGGAPVP